MKVPVMAPYRAAARMMMPQNRHIKHLLWTLWIVSPSMISIARDKLVLVNKLGAKSVHGDDAISFTKTVDDSNMYYVISMCKQKEQAPYSFVLYKDGQPHTLTTREACTSNGIETISLPAKNFPDATSLSIINIGNTDLVVSVYEVKEPHHE